MAEVFFKILNMSITATYVLIVNAGLFLTESPVFNRRIFGSRLSLVPCYQILEY